MTEFFDTSVLVASFWESHPGHEASFRRVAAAHKKTSACSLHTIAEIYATMTALPVKDVISPEEALLFIQQVRDRFSLIILDEQEYCRTIEQAAERHFGSGRIYDALLLACASKCKAQIIYTWNLKHFKVIDPLQAGKMRTP